MRSQLTPRQVALAIGVSEASLKRWCDRGFLPSVRTAGGHRRLPLHGVLSFLRSRGQVVSRPELLGLPPSTGHGPLVFERGRAEMRRALLEGDEESFRRLGFDLFLGGNRAVDILEMAVAPAFCDLGRDVLHGSAEIYQERRAIEMCMRFLHEMRNSLPPPSDDAPIAIGGTAEHDPYSLPTAMVEVALREAGWRADSFGTGNPLRTLRAAIDRIRPTLFWMSVSTVAYREALLEDWRDLHETAVARGTAVVVGGRGIDAELRRRMPADYAADSLSGLVEFARRLPPAHRQGARAS